MPSKPPSQWSPAYAKRRAQAELKGLVGPAARGHKPNEHVTRAVNKGLPPPTPRRRSAPPPPPPKSKEQIAREMRSLRGRQRRAEEKAAAKAQGSLTKDQQRQVRKFGQEQADRASTDAERVVNTLMFFAANSGWDAFLRVRRTRNILLKQYARERANGQYIKREGYDFSDLMQEDDEDPIWFYYH